MIDFYITGILAAVVASGSVATNLAPVADAGADRSTFVHQTLNIKGSGADSDGSIVSCLWKEGDKVLSQSCSLAYTPATAGMYSLTLTVTDDDGATGSDTMRVNATAAPNQAPTADAGADTSVEVGKSVTLTGTGKDSDGNIVRHQWKEGGTLLSSNWSFSYRPTTTGYHSLTLTVTDDDGATGSDTMGVNATAAPNQAPTADAGADTSVEVGKSVTLTGTGKDSDGNIVRHQWKEGGTLLSSNWSFSYRPTTTAYHSLTLTVTDDDGATGSDTIRVNATAAPNQAPTANAGADKSVVVNHAVSLTGAGRDSDGQITRYQWLEGSTILSTRSSLSYTPSSTGRHILTFKVWDDDNATASDTVTVTATAGSTPPVAKTIVITKTGQTTSYKNGDDATYRKGSANSFTRNSSTKVVADSSTGLMWEDKIYKNTSDSSWNAWTPTDGTPSTVQHCSALTLGGYKDWRVPTKDEMSTLIDYSQSPFFLNPIFKAKPRSYAFNYFVAEAVVENSEHHNHHYYANFETGVITTNYRESRKLQTRCVRSDVVWPTTPHIVKGNKVATDTDTGLMWEDTGWDLKSSSKRTSWNVALNKCENLNLAGYSDWRLPNVKEMLSLMEYKERDGSPVKMGVATRPYCRGGNWTSTTVPQDTSKAYFVGMSYGFSSINISKTSAAFGRCVRDAR